MNQEMRDLFCLVIVPFGILIVKQVDGGLIKTSKISSYPDPTLRPLVPREWDIRNVYNRRVYSRIIDIRNKGSDYVTDWDCLDRRGSCTFEHKE